MDPNTKPDSGSDNGLAAPAGVVPSPVPAVPAPVPQTIAPTVAPKPDDSAAGQSVAQPQAGVTALAPAQPANVTASPVQAPAQPQKSSRRFKVLLVAAVVVVALVVGLLIRHSMQEAAWQRATAAYDAKNYDKAAKELKGLPMPSDPDRLKVYAQTMLSTRQLDQALAAYQKLYELRPDPSVKLVIGNIYNEQKNTAEAAKVYQEIIASDPHYAQAYANLATLYRLQSKTDEARATLSQGVKNAPADVSLRELLVSAWLDDKTSPEFRQAVEGLRKLNPDDPLLMSIKQ